MLDLREWNLHKGNEVKMKKAVESRGKERKTGPGNMGEGTQDLEALIPVLYVLRVWCIFCAITLPQVWYRID